MRRFLCSVVVLAASATPLLLGGSGAAASGTGGVLIPSSPHERLPATGGTVSSTNWSGYVVSSSKKITAVTTTFTVPTESKPPSGYASTWGGIGGFGTKHLIQAGVSEQTSGNHYFPWYEMLPASETTISEPVSPGDQITVTITEVTTNHWKISLNDAGHWSWTKTFTYSASQNSAEWILEAPTINGGQSTLPGLTPAFFGTTSTFVKGGSTETIAKGNPTKILMVKGSGKREATPSALASNGQSFDSCAWKTSCATP